MYDIDKIYREHASTVYKFLYTKTQNADWAEELTQETFYRAMNSLSRYDGSCKITTWLCQTGKHIWQQELAKKSKYQTCAISEDLATTSIGIEDQLIQAEQEIKIMTALHHLREVFYLRILGDLSYK